MNLEDVQPYVLGKLQAAAAVGHPLNGIPILSDDGTYPKTPGREAALRDVGIVLIVWQIESDGLVSASPNGMASHDIYVPVLIEENPAVCRAAGALNFPAEKALRLVLQAVPGKPPGAMRPTNSVEVHDPPFQSFGTIQGVRRFVANFVLRNEVILPQ